MTEQQKQAIEKIWGKENCEFGKLYFTVKVPANYTGFFWLICFHLDLTYFDTNGNVDMETNSKIQQTLKVLGWT